MMMQSKGAKLDQNGGLIMDTFIELPYGGPGARFCVSELVDHIRSTERDYIIQGQQNCILENHTKPHSLDVWLRKGFTNRKDTKQAVNQVVEALTATGWFEIARLPCPDSGRLCKGLRLLDPRFNEENGQGIAYKQQSICQEYQQGFQRVDEVAARIQRFQVEPDFSRDVAKRTSVVPDFDLADDAILKALVRLIAYSNNAKSDAVGRIMQSGIFDTIFDHYDVQGAARLDPHRIVEEYWPQIKGIRFKYKIARMIGCANCLLDIQSRHGSFMQYLGAQNIPVIIRTTVDLGRFWKGFDAVRADFKIMKMPYLRNFTSLCHLFLRLGYDCAKPDSAVMKAAVDLRIASSSRKDRSFSDRERRKVIRFMQLYAMCRGIRVPVVDLYFLIHGGQRGARQFVQSTYYL
jgi:hypothetical protein